MQKLLDEVNEARLSLDAVKSRVFRNLRRVTELGNGLFDVGVRHFSRSFAHEHSARNVYELFRIDRWGRDRKPAVGEKNRVRHRTLMPKLGEDMSTTGVDDVCNGIPRGSLFGVVNPRRAVPTLAVLTDPYAFADNETGRSSLLVIFAHQLCRHVSVIGRPRPGQRGAITTRLRRGRSPIM